MNTPDQLVRLTEEENKMNFVDSTKAKEAAKRFIEALKSGKIKKDVLPDKAENYSKEEEKKDIEHFCKFAETQYYKELIEGQHIVFCYSVT